MKLQLLSMPSALYAFITAAAMLLPAAAPAQAAAAEDVQILTRGPVHEAFAESVSYNPQAGLIVKSAPPAAIEELPPEQQLEGDNVTWISGYWAWDDDQNDFLWISGVWRNLPPGRQWVPGYWSDIGDGQYQWTSGYWADSTTTEVAYIPSPPPRNIDAGANIDAPADDSSWIPGNWMWTDARYVWRPGYWTPLRTNWTWVPARFCWTRRGYVFIDGYWDYAVACRGVLFAPVYFNRHIYATPGYYYTPSIVVALNVFTDHLFVRPRCGHYYFGDYYASRYRDAGYYASYTWHGRDHGYDPIYAYDRWHHRHEQGWENRRRDDFNYFRTHEDARPPHTWAAMRDFHNDRFNDGRNRLFATSLDGLARNPEQGQRFRPLDRDRRDQFVAQNREMIKFSQERSHAEARNRVAGDNATPNAPRENLARSPISGRQADRFAANEAPPKRPEARGTGNHMSPGGQGGNLSETGGNNAVRRSGERLGATNELTRDHGSTALDTHRNAADPQTLRQSTGRESSTGKGKHPEQADQLIPGRKTELGARGERQPDTTGNPTHSLKDQVTKQHDPQPKSQVRELPQPKVQSMAQREYQPEPQIHEMPQRKVQVDPQPQIRQLPQPKVQSMPQREYQPEPQIHEMPQRKVQVDPQPQVRQLPQPNVQSMPQRDYQPKAQVREMPQRQMQITPQPQIQSSRQAPSNDNRDRGDKKKDRSDR